MVRFRVFLVLGFSTVAPIVLSLYYGHKTTNFFDDIIIHLYQDISEKTSEIQEFFALTKQCFSSGTGLHAVQQEIARLKEENLKIKLLEKENADLRNLNNYVDTVDFDFVTTRVVGASKNHMGIKFMINIGSDLGVSEGYGVINKNGLMGRVFQVSHNAARVISITSSHSKIPVLLIESGIHCIAAGVSEEDELQLLYVPDNAKPIDGEIAVTSGEGGILPFGIRVGTVQKRKNAEDEFSLKIENQLNQAGIAAVAKP